MKAALQQSRADGRDAALLNKALFKKVNLTEITEG